MTTEITTLGNGVRVVTDHMEHMETVSLGVWVGAGARHETDNEHGISHFLEHMAFKGTATRSAEDIAIEIEEVGGDLNAATSLEQTAYFSRVLKNDDEVALRLFADILLNSAFRPDDVERERDVILQEIAASRDSPEDLAYDLLQDAAFPRQSLGRPILGTRDSVSRFSSNDFRTFRNRWYGPQNLVFSAAGAITHDPFVRHVEALFGGLTRDTVGPENPALYEGGERSSDKPFEQSHLLLGFAGPSYRSDAFYAVQVFSNLFGGGMSSRLFQEVRERRGLCYAIYSSAWGLKDTGMFAVHAATGADMMGELIDVVSSECVRFADLGPAPAELNRAKAQLKAGLLMSLESSSARAEQMSRQMMAHGRIVPPQELIAKVEAVTSEDVRQLASEMFATEPCAVVVGAGPKSIDHARAAAQLVAV